ncbi:MAG: transporter substrate-binding protein [Treponema sp.]|nr:transporter substrate-binding protein [Treponema sp.]
MKIFRKLAVIAACAALFAFTGCGEKKAASDEVKLGLLCDITGDLAINGAITSNAMKFAVEEINANGGIDGKQIKLIVYDTQSDNTVYQDMARKLCLEDKVSAVFGGITSASREAIRPILEEYEMPYFYAQQYEGGVASHYTFCTGCIPEMQIDPIVEYLLNEKPGARCYIWAADYNFGQITSEWIVKSVKDHGGSIINIEFVPLGVSQFSSTIANINAAKPDVVFSIAAGAAQMSFYEQWSNAKFADIPLVTTTSGLMCGEHKIFEAPALANLHVASPYFEELNTPEAQAFTKKFREKVSASEVPYLGMDIETVYDTVYLYKKAVEKAGSTDAEAVIAALETGISVDGPAGTVTINGKDHHAIKNSTAVRIEKDHSVTQIVTMPNVKSNFIESLGIDLSKSGKDSPNVQYTPSGN